MRYKQGSLEACANSFITYKTARGSNNVSKTRQKKDAGAKSLKPSDIIQLLDAQNWESPYEYGIHFYISGAKNSKAPMDTIAYFKSCGKYVKSSIGKAEKFGYILPTIDRIDSSKPYSKDNIQFVSPHFNNLKSKLSTEEALSSAERIHKD